MGGALANVAALDIVEHFSRRVSAVSLITFGAPRVGNYEFHQLLNDKVKHTLRVVNNRDAVTALPQWVWFKHGGHVVRIDGHGNYWMNPTFMEKAFLESQNSVQDHAMQAYLDSLVAVARTLMDTQGDPREQGTQLGIEL